MLLDPHKTYRYDTIRQKINPLCSVFITPVNTSVRFLQVQVFGFLTGEFSTIV